MKNIFKISILISAFGFFQACDNNLELEPYTALDASVGFKTKQDVDAHTKAFRKMCAELIKA